MQKILAINPGATSTKFAVFEDETIVFKKIVEHQGHEMENFKRVFDQFAYRLELIVKALAEGGVKLNTLDAVVGRGGLLKPLAGGTYIINEQMVEDMKVAAQGEHASNLGAVIAFQLAKQLKIPAYIVDPVSVDELEPVARITGLPEFSRVSMSHALNMKAVGRKVAAKLGKNYQEVHFVVAHLGTGVSLSVQSGGRMIDIIDSKEEGPFAPDRCGGLPMNQLIKLCYSQKYTYDELRRKIFGSGGFYAHVKTKDLRQIEKMSSKGDDKAKLLLSAFCYQVAKAIGALATVLKGEVDRIILTGGMAHSDYVVREIISRIQFIAPVEVVPGEEELESLAAGALRVLRQEEVAKVYQ